MFTRLKALKVEIEHLQFLMEKAKVKLQKEFEAWWAEEATSLQVLAACPLLPQSRPSPCGLGNIRAAGEGSDTQPPWGCQRQKRWGFDPQAPLLSALAHEASAHFSNEERKWSGLSASLLWCLTRGKVGMEGIAPQTSGLPSLLSVMFSSDIILTM